ncbi:uncharacterized protein LOC134206913 [Armigeres subalbatus]|uniref:uncharacterized protein LOC134206913 n=1 Tax=Armigeres subalbatus TaxID=124917 RepID=UPI002ED57ACB
MAETKLHIDSELLIAAVFLRKELWEQRSRNFRNRILVDRSWQEIAEEFNACEDTVEERWKALRDSYGKVLKNLPVSKSGDAGGENFDTSWPYFKCMHFLREQMKPRKTTGNLASPQPNAVASDTVIDEGDVDVHYEDIEILDEEAPGWFEVSEPSTSSNSKVSAPAPHKKKKLTRSSQSTRLLEIEQRKLELLEKKASGGSSRDEDDTNKNDYLL